jgi:NAD+ diphosphatase
MWVLMGMDPRTSFDGVTYPHLRLAEPAHDRLGVHRKDDAWLDARWADPSTRVLVVSGTRVRPRDGALEWAEPAQAPDGTRILLGERDGTTWWAVITEGTLAAEEKDAWLPLRGLLPALAGGATDEAPLVFHALGLAEWHWATRFCPRCGGTLESQAAGHELRCTQCGRAQFPRTDPAVIMLVTHGEPGTDDERCLLGRQAIWPEGRFSTLAGFCEPGETLEDAVRREVAEEVGVRIGEVGYFGNQPWPLPASLMLGMVGRAVSTDITVDADEIEDARWFTRTEMREQAEAGTLVLPGGVSISRSLVEHWYGGPLPGQW